MRLRERAARGGARHRLGALVPATFPRGLVSWGLALTVLALLVRLPLFGIAYAAADTHQYVETAQGIFHGGFSNDLRPPGYPILLSGFELVGLDPVNAAVVFANLVGILLPACVLVVGWRYFSLFVGVVAGFLTAASPLMISVEQLALPDYLFGVCFFFATVFLAEAVIAIRSGPADWRLLAASGALYGLATLLRANGLIGLVGIPLILLIAAAPAWRPALRAAAIGVAAGALVVAPWFLHNVVKFGDPSIAIESGISLYARVISWEEVPPRDDTPEGRVALSVYNTADMNQPRSVLTTTTGVYNALRDEGLSPAEAAGAMGGLAREAIRREPGTYGDSTAEILGLYHRVYDPRTLTSDPNLDQIIAARNYFRTFSESDPAQSGELPGDSALTRVPWQLAQVVNRLLYLLTIGGLLMLALPFFGPTRSRLAAFTFLFAGGLALLGVSMTAKWEPRYAIAFAPFVWILGGAAVDRLARLLAAAVRRPGLLRSRDATA